MKQQCQSAVIISTDGSDNQSMDIPSLEKAYKIFESAAYSGFNPTHSSHVPLSTFSGRMDMQSAVLSDRTMDASVSLDGAYEMSGYLM